MTEAMLFELKQQIVAELRSEFILTPKGTPDKADRPEALVNAIKAFVCTSLNFSIEEVESRCRKSEYTKARQIISVMARSMGGVRMSLSTIGASLRRDHAQVLYYLRSFDAECSYNKSLKFDEQVIRQAFLAECGHGFKIYQTS